MHFTTLFKHWGSIAAICQDFKVSHQSVYNWRKAGIVPKGIACEAQILSKGKVLVNFTMYAPRVDRKVSRGA